MEFPRRRNFLINKALQIRFALAISILIFISTIGVWFLLHGVLKTMMGNQWAGTPADIQFLQNTNWIILGVIVADALAIFSISVTFSHLVAGPLFRIEKSLKELLENGHARPIVLRKYDMLQDTADLANKIIAKFSR